MKMEYGSNEDGILQFLTSFGNIFPNITIQARGLKLFYNLLFIYL